MQAEQHAPHISSLGHPSPNARPDTLGSGVAEQALFKNQFMGLLMIISPSSATVFCPSCLPTPLFGLKIESWGWLEGGEGVNTTPVCFLQQSQSAGWEQCRDGKALERREISKIIFVPQENMSW